MKSFLLALFVIAAIPAAAQQPAVNPNAKTIADFQTRLDQYIALHKKFEGSLPALSKESTPQQIDKHQRDLAGLIAKARATAKQGDLFTADMQLMVRTLIKQVFAQGDAALLRDSIMDENPVGVKLTVNGRYPDTVPLTTMPTEVLKGLPPLQEGLEYRFVGENLILFDPHAHMIADFVPSALPKK